MVNKRFSPRSALKQPAELVFSSDQALAALLLDISLGGAAVLVDRQLNVGTTLKLITTLKGPENSEAFQAMCQVTAVQPARYDQKYVANLQFADIGEDHQRILARFMRLS
jgi:c-di-GMP-binding flagellar brake protein YcgR